MPPAEASQQFTSGRPGPDVRFAVRLPHARGAAGDARHVVKNRLGNVLPGETLDDALIVVSELVTNAVLHGKGDIELRMAFDGERIKGEVADEGIRFRQQPRKQDPDHVGGRCLDLVWRIVNDWGLNEESNRVWFELLAHRQS